MRQRAVAVMLQPVAHVLGEVQRHRTLGPEQAEKPHTQPRRSRDGAFEGGDGGRGEVELGHLCQAPGFLPRPQGRAGSRSTRVQRVEPAHQREEVVRPGLFRHIGEQRIDRFAERVDLRLGRPRPRIDRSAGADAAGTGPVRHRASLRGAGCRTHAICPQPPRAGQALMTPRCWLRKVSWV